MLVSDNACIVFFSVYYILALNFQDSIYSHEVMVFVSLFFSPPKYDQQLVKRSACFFTLRNTAQNKGS